MQGDGWYGCADVKDRENRSVMNEARGYLCEKRCLTLVMHR